MAYPSFLVGGGLQITMGITSVLMVDLFPGTGGAITASASQPNSLLILKADLLAPLQFNLTRCLLAAAATAVIDPVVTSIGEGWAFTLFSAIIVVLAPLPIILVKKGPAWRKQRFDALKSKADAKDHQQKIAQEKPKQAQ
jgi:hypothetical protein